MIQYKNRTIYLGRSSKIFNELRNLLQENHISYRYKMHNHNEALIAPGLGTARSQGGNLSNMNDDIYEILVSKENEAKALYLLQSIV